MNNVDTTTELLSIAEAALKLRVSERTVARLIADGQLHAPKIRRRRLVSMASMQGLLKDNTAKTLGTTPTRASGEITP
jgi:excisionase family DNA binding protein